MAHRALGFTLILLFFPASLLAIDIDGEVRIGPRRGLAKPATVQLVRELQVVYEQFTDLDGRFEFHSVEPSRYLVRARYEDFPETEVPVDVVGRNTHYRVPITIKLPKAARIGKSGVVSVDKLLIPREAKKEYEDGLKSRRSGDCVRAVSRLRKAIELAPKYGEAYNELGNCLKGQSKFADAEAAFAKAIELNATIYPSINLADLYALQKRFEDARRVLEVSVAKNPTEGDLFFALARIHFDQGHMKEAEAAGLEAHSRIHRTADVHLLLAKIYLSLKNYPALVTHLETYLIENPTGPVADQVRQSLKIIPHP